MAVYGLENTSPFYPGLDGLPLQNGKIWFGVSGQNPVTNPTTVYLDSAGTQPVAQPVAVSNGRTVDAYGNPISLYMPGDFSRLVQDAQGRTVLTQTSQPQTQSAASAASSATAAAASATVVTTNLPAINAVAGDLPNIDTAATNITNVNNVGTNIAIVSQAAAATRIRDSGAAGDADATLSVGDYFYAKGVAASDVLELWKKNGTGGLDTGKRYPTITGVTTRAEQQSNLIRTDRTITVGPATPATGTNASQGTYIVAGRPIPAGLIDNVKIFANGTGTVKLKRFTRAGETFTFVSEMTLNVVAGLNTFSWADGTLSYTTVNDGEYFGFFPSSGTIMKFNTVTAPSGTEYHFGAGDVTTTLAIAGSAIPTTDTQLQVSVTVRLADDGTAAMVTGERNDWGGSTYLGARTVGLPTSPQFLSTNLIYYEDHVFKETSKLQTITVHAELACLMKVFILSPSAGQFTLLRAFTVALAVGDNTLTAGTHFPADAVVPQGGLIGHRALRTSAIPASVFITRRYRQASTEPATTVTGFDQGTSNSQTHQIRYDFVKQQTVRKIVDRTQYLLDEDFNGSAIPLNFTATNWTQGTNVATSGALGLANPLEWNYVNPYFSKSKHRVWFTFNSAAASILVYRKPNANGSLGTIFEADMTGNTLRVYAAWTGGTVLPSVSQTKTCSFSFTTGNAYEIVMEKSYMTLTFTITDKVTGATDSITIDAHASLAAGAMLGAPGVAQNNGTAGGVSVDRFTYLSSVKDPKVILFGDSITEGSGSTLMSDAWSYKVAEAAGGLTSAHSGETSNITLIRVERELRMFQPKFAIVMIGTNDTNMTTFQDSIGFIAEKCLNAGVTPVFCTIPPEAADTNPVLVQNPFIRASGYRYIDMARALTVGGDGTTRDATKFADSLHPNTAGSAAMYLRAQLDLPEIFD